MTRAYAVQTLCRPPREASKSKAIQSESTLPEALSSVTHRATSIKKLLSPSSPALMLLPFFVPVVLTLPFTTQAPLLVEHPRAFVIIARVNLVTQACLLSSKHVALPAYSARLCAHGSCSLWCCQRLLTTCSVPLRTQSHPGVTREAEEL